MTKKRTPLNSLSASQQEIMQIIWELGEVTAREVLLILSKKRKVARNTVRTTLERMEQKGWLAHRKDGRTHVYYAALPRETTIGQKIVEVIDNMCGGSPEALVTALLDYRGLDDGEIKRIRAVLSEAKKAAKKRKG